MISILPRIFKKYIGLLFVSYLSAFPSMASEPMFDVKVEGHGQPVILIPGLMSSGDVWYEVVNRFKSNAQFHVLSVAGFAGTPPAEAPSLMHLVDDIHAYIENNNLSRPMIIGHSMGGLAALNLASKYPNMTGQIISIDGLPFIGPVFTGTNKSTVESMQAQALQMKTYFTSLSAEQLEQQTRLGVSRQTTSARNQNRLVSMAKQSDSATVGAMMFDVMTTDLRQSLDNIRQPITLIGATGALADQIAKDHAKALYLEQLETAKNAKLIMHEDARHFVMLDKPDWLNQQLAVILGHMQ